MTKKTWSMILLCASAVIFLLVVALCIYMATTLFALKNSPVDTSAGSFPGASVLAVILAELSVWGGFLLFGFALSSTGWIFSLINIKIAESKTIKAVSIGFTCFYSAVMLLVVGIFIGFIL